MDHYRLSDELRNQLLENAAWGKAGVTPRLDEKASCDSYDKPAKKKKAKKADEKHDEKDDKKDDEAPVEDSVEVEAEGEELAEAHVCPLCVSQLDEAIDEERLLEHLNVVVGLVDRLTQLQEGEEGDIESIIDETLAELLFADDDEDAE